RALLTIGGTVAGLAALLSFKTHPLGALASTAPPAPVAGSSSATPPAAQGIGSAEGMGQGGAPAKAASTAKPASTGKPAGTTGRGSGATGAGGNAATSSRTVTGSVASTQYGPMQVAVTVAGTRITKVTVLQQTDRGAQSSQIDATRSEERRVGKECRSSGPPYYYKEESKKSSRKNKRPRNTE